jgi:hypothetical protein
MSTPPVDKSFAHSPAVISEKELTGTGMAFTLIFLLSLLYFPTSRLFLLLGIVTLVVTMTVPKVLRPLAIVWFKFSHLLGNVMSRVVLGLVYLVIIVPMGLLVQTFRGDTLRLKAFKKNKESVFIERQHTYVASDLLHPY